MAKKVISKRLNKACAVCGKSIKVILYADRSYRNGHYFGKLDRSREYWECPKCYWKK
ncbi:MAG: hypothetical protein Q8P32_03165 [Candidatus Komeilibacteria bacterium]|nr:hypothetical protein [Candidatus Komeilibacteria bacterium]